MRLLLPSAPSATPLLLPLAACFPSRCRRVMQTMATRPSNAIRTGGDHPCGCDRLQAATCFNEAPCVHNEGATAHPHRECLPRTRGRATVRRVAFQKISRTNRAVPSRAKSVHWMSKRGSASAGATRRRHRRVGRRRNDFAGLGRQVLPAGPLRDKRHEAPHGDGAFRGRSTTRRRCRTWPVARK